MSNSANYKNYADWNGINGNVTSVGTNGAASFYGTSDQCGNIWEITESKVDDRFIILGGAYNTSVDSLISCSGYALTEYDFKSNNIGGRLCASIYNYDIGELVHVTGTNSADSRTDKGAVDYDYYITKFTITNGQYVDFLNSVDPSGTNTQNLYSSLMSINYDESDNKRGGILFEPNNLIGSKYVAKTNFKNKPVNYISILELAKLCNWLHNNKDPNNILTGSYNIVNGIERETNANYWIPSEDEWYKAAYYTTNKNNSGNPGYWSYATQSDVIPCPINQLGCVVTLNVNNGDGSYPIIYASPTPTPTVTASPTPTQTATPSVTPSQTQTSTQTPTPSITASSSNTPTPTETPTQTPTNTPTQTPTKTPTQTPTQTPTSTSTPTNTPTPTQTPSVTPTNTPTPSVTPSQEPVEYDNLLYRTYSIKKYPDNAKELNLMSPPSGYENEQNDWFHFINSIGTIYSESIDDAILLSYNTIYTNNSGIIPNTASSLTSLSPGKSYFYILNEFAEYPVKIPIYYNYPTKYINNKILEQLNQIKIQESESYILADTFGTNITYDKIIKSLNYDINKYSKNLNYIQDIKLMYSILELIEEEYINNGYGNTSVVEKTDYCNNTTYAYNWKLNEITYDFDPIVNPSSILTNNIIQVSGLVAPINISLNNLPNNPNINLSYRFIANTGTKSCSIYPISGTIPNTENYTISSMFEFHSDSLRHNNANLLK